MERILVIDDDEPTLEVIKQLFEFEGFLVMDLKDYSKLDAAIHSFTPNLILMDVVLGGADGRDLCKNLKSSEHRDIPIILMSVLHGFYTDKDNPLYSEDYIQKPFDIDVMVHKVTNQLRSTNGLRLGKSSLWESNYPFKNL